MNAQLEALARRIQLSAPHHRRLRLVFGHACVGRVSQHFERDDVVQAYAGFGAFLAARLAPADFDALSEHVAHLARSHPGSASIDGSQHAAVSATHALARAMQAQALEAAAYAAYAQVYGYGAYAVRDPAAFEDEHRAQCALLERLWQDCGSTAAHPT